MNNQKPTTIKMVELEEKLIKVLNDSELSCFNMKIALENVFHKVEASEQQEIKQYQESIKEESENDKKTKKDNK